MDWFSSDSRWYQQEFAGPELNRKEVLSVLAENLESGLPLVRVRAADKERTRLMLLVRADVERGIWWLWRPHIPWFGYLDVVKRVAIMRQADEIVFVDPFPEIGRYLDSAKSLMNVYARWCRFLKWRQEVRTLISILLAKKEYALVKVLRN